ncbi:MAG TPA: hypothetical protein VNW95_01705 [Mucilaginibacter sp.]|jgi:hypothetical protein|nr:hypothetical protein [Mucilaginibacter sp.]
MKKIIIAALVILSTGVLSTSCIQQGVKKTSVSFYANPFSAKNNIGSAD